MKRELKRKIAFLLSLALCISIFYANVYANVYAKEESSEVTKTAKEESSKVTKSDKEEAKKIKKKTDNLSDKEFDDFIVDYINTNIKTVEDIEKTQEILNLADIELNDIDTKKHQEIGNTRYISPSYVELTSYSVRRGGDTYNRLFGQIVHNATEWSCASLDLLSLEWDYTKATYYGTTTSDFVTYMDGSNRNKGICLFNVDDYEMYAGDYVYAVVYVVPKVKGVWIEYASKYIHTFGTTEVNWNVGGNIGYTNTGATAGLTFSISGKNSEQSWSMYSDNAFRRS